MKKTKILKTRHLIIVALIFATLAILGPIIINEIYKQNTGYITLWGARDVLMYYGSLLGGIATIVALILTIIYTTQRSKLEQEYQRKYLFADYKKTVIEERYREIFTNAALIKSVMLLEFLDDAGNILTMLINRNNWVLNINNQLFNNDYILQSLKSVEFEGSEEGKAFLGEIARIQEGIYERLRNLPEELVKAEEENKIFEGKRKDIKYRLNESIREINTKINGLEIPSKEKKPETQQDILNRYKENIIQYRDEYKYDFMEAYDGFVKYKKSCESEEIQKLYKFNVG